MKRDGCSRLCNAETQGREKTMSEVVGAMEQIPELSPPSSTPTEWSEVERPLLLQLVRMGWQCLCGDIDVPELTEREHFRQLLLKDRLRQAIRTINADGGSLDDLTVDRALRQLEVTGGQALLEKNKLLTERLIKGVSVEATEGSGPGRRQRRIRFIDFEHPENNDFLAINQFRVDLPGGNTFVVPDIVLFVNGIPLVVIECKSPSITDPISAGLDQLLRYSNHRYWIEEDEGVEELFLLNQLIVVTSFYEAKVGTLGGYHEHYQEWKDTSPIPLETVAEELGKAPDRLKSQEVLVAGVLRPTHLLDVLQNFILFQIDDGRLIKLIPRYQQFRAVHKTIDRLLTGHTKAQDDQDQDRRDGATVKIVYEGRTAEGLVEQTDHLDQVFEDMFREYTEAEQQLIKNKYAAAGDVLEAPKLIAAKAVDMLRHYVRTILPNGFKAQVVAGSRLAAVRYCAALGKARDELLQQLEQLDPTRLQLSEEALEQEPEFTRYFVEAHKHLNTIRRLEFAAVISHDHNDPPSWRVWSDKARQESHIARFKKPLVHAEPEKQGGLAFLCVQNMLLTGFDAPIEQVLYLDRRLVAHDLLQAIARVNRRSQGKDCGYVVDYIGVAHHLHDALGDYEGETHDPMLDIRNELPTLRDRHQRVLDVFLARGIGNIRDVEACVDLLDDVKIRAEFINKLRLFLESLGTMMPRPEAMPYLRDAKILGFIAKVAANLYRDDQLSLHGVKHKVKQLIDEYIAANGIDPKIPPIEILDVNFAEKVQEGPSAKARASQMLHAARHHISIHLNEDPTYFTTLSEKLEQILQELQDNWTELEAILHRFIEEELQRGREQEVAGLDPKMQAPFFGLLKEAIEANSGVPLTDTAFRTAVDTTVAIVAHMQEEIRRVGFWRDGLSRQRLENWVYRRLNRTRLMPSDKVQELAVRMVDLAKHRHRFLVL